jgi:hypothetical protein
MVSLQIAMLSAPTSLASIMVIGPHHAAVTHVGGSSEVGQREHMARQGFTRKCWSLFLCLGDYLAPPRQVGGFVPRDAFGRARGRSPIGYIHMLTMWDLDPTWLAIISQVIAYALVLWNMG